MLSIDLKNSFNLKSGADNFTVLLLRLIAKSDGENRAKLARGYPAEVKAVEIFQQWCPYADMEHTEPDWNEIARRAEEFVKMSQEKILATVDEVVDKLVPGMKKGRGKRK